MLKLTFLSIFLFLSTQTILSQNVSRTYRINRTVTFEQEFYSDSKKKDVKRSINLNLKRSDNNALDMDLLILIGRKEGVTANVKFGKNEDSNKLLVNFCLPTKLLKSGDDKNVYYYYELKNRQSVNIRFSQMSFDVLSTPLKINLADGKQRFTTGPNLGVLTGRSWGKTRFTHRSHVGNIQIDKKQTFGFYSGVSKVNFNFTNPANAQENAELVLFSPGLGYLLSYQRFNFGATLGLDFALGKNSSNWDFQGSSWIGVNLGYTLFSF
ncbi:MAG: hypothetical protein CMD35_06600 [Flavobacteriales bacterium]|nr:hypothetical protein [Flavobacteriales bacterium]|tara:strand:- start:196 stop:996 length:801 start_codon:yes stop_codon:yes gene_type:complete